LNWILQGVDSKFLSGDDEATIYPPERLATFQTTIIFQKKKTMDKKSHKLTTMMIPAYVFHEQEPNFSNNGPDVSA
jgi:hypothetical protein